MGRVQLLHESLSYTVRGILYTVHNYLGTYRNEKQYYRKVLRVNEQEGIDWIS
jgi:hypothetical protein